jgi:hypothetical protein
MTSRADFVQPPPRIAVWLVTLFSPAEEAESILGDLLEEFSHLASQSGVAFARRWYWRQTVKTIAHLIGSGFRTAPWTITTAVVGGFLLRWFVSWRSSPAIKGAIDTVLNQVYEHDVYAHLFWLRTTMLITGLVINTLVGGFVAALAKGREMTATITLALAGNALAIQAALLTVAKTGDHGVLWTLPHTFAFSVALVVGGAIVRTRRSATTTRPSAT